MQTLHNLYPQDKIKCTESKKVGMDTNLIHEWIDTVWRPYTKTIRGPMYLIIDKFPPHKVKLVLLLLAGLVTDVDFIPAGYISVTQPVDVVINAPLKNITNATAMHGSWQASTFC